MARAALPVFAAVSVAMAGTLSACSSVELKASTAASSLSFGESLMVSMWREAVAVAAAAGRSEPERFTTENRSESAARPNKSAPNEHWERRVSRDARRAHSEAD